MQAGKNPEPRKRYKSLVFSHYRFDKYIKLVKPHKNPRTSFFKVLNNRKSEKSFEQLSLDQIGHLLWSSAKAKKILSFEQSTIISHRNAPSAGGIHPIDILVSLPENLRKRNLCYYDPFMHRLCKLKLDKNHTSAFFKIINNCIPITNATLFWFVVDTDRTAVKYNNYESLVWRDAGALLMTFQLVATALNFKSCPVGTLGIPFLSKSFGKNLLSAGGILLG